VPAKGRESGGAESPRKSEPTWRHRASEKRGNPFDIVFPAFYATPSQAETENSANSQAPPMVAGQALPSSPSGIMSPSSAMNPALPRRSFLKPAATVGALAGIGDLDFLSGLPRVSAAEARLDPRAVQFSPDVEPLVRLLEDTPRERLLEEVGTRIKRD